MQFSSSYESGWTRVQEYIPFREKEEGSGEKCCFDEAKEETGQEGPSEIVRSASQAASGHSDSGGQREQRIHSPDYTPNHHACW